FGFGDDELYRGSVGVALGGQHGRWHDGHDSGTRLSELNSCCDQQDDRAVLDERADEWSARRSKLADGPFSLHRPGAGAAPGTCLESQPRAATRAATWQG